VDCYKEILLYWQSAEMGLAASQNVGPAFEELGPRSPKDRARSAILGAFVADAASMPLNRIYDQGALDKLLRGRSRRDHTLNKQKHEQGREEEVLEPEIPEFFSPCSCPFYSLSNGENSPYGKEAYPLLHSISSCGFFDKEHVSEFMFKCMRGPEFPADEKDFRASVAAEGKNLHHVAPPPSNENSGSSFNSHLRLYVGYQQQPRLCGSLSRLFLENRLQGLPWEQCASATDIQCLGIVCVPIIVARYAGSGSRMIDAVEACVQIRQTHSYALEVARLAARLLEQVVLGKSVYDALRWGLDSNSGSNLPPSERAYLERALVGHTNCIESVNFGQGIRAERADFIGQPFSLAAEQLGLDSQSPGCMLTSLVALRAFRDYKSAVRANIVAGGDSALRAWFIGAMLAAEGGETAIPIQWRTQCSEFGDVWTLASRIAGSNPHFNSLQEINYCRVVV